MTKRAAADRVMMRKATSDDAVALSRFAARSFQETFGADSTPSDMEAYLAKAFGPTVQAAEIADVSATIFIAVDQSVPGGQLVGYAHLIKHGATMELKRLYLDARWQGTGLAPIFMGRIHEECRQAGAERLQLTVWAENHRAIAFYVKTGFRVTGTETFMLGDDAQTDHVMEMAVPSPGAGIRSTDGP